MTIEQLAKLIADNAKTKKWLSAHFDVDHNGNTYRIGVKAIGRWVQRLELCGIVSNVPEQKTNKRLVEVTIAELHVCLNSIGA